jgi:hypothetical protein
MKKKLLKLSISTVTALLFVACGSSGSSKDEVVDDNVGEVKSFILSVVGELNVTKPTDNQTEITAEDMVMSADGTKVFLADGSAGLKVIDVTNPKAPKLVGEYDDVEDNTDANRGGFGRRIAISSDRKTVYMADGLAGLKVIDVSNPTNPTLKGKLDTDGFSHGITVSPDGKVVYVSDNGEDGGTPGFRIINVEDGTDPYMIHERAEQWATQVAISNDGKTAYVTDKLAGILIVDVSDAENGITTLGTYTVTDGGISADIVLSKDGKTAYVANKKPGIKILDVNDSANPKLISKFDTDKIAKSIALSSDGKTLFVADRQAGVQAIDVSNSKAPKLLGKVKTSSAEDVMISKDGNYLYVADGKSGIKVIKITK